MIIHQKYTIPRENVWFCIKNITFLHCPFTNRIKHTSVLISLLDLARGNTDQ